MNRKQAKRNVLLAYLALFGLPCVVRAQFALKDNATVVFYGDSITAQRLYTRCVEDFVLTRYPSLNVRFVNAGVPGDTVLGGYAGAMLERVRHDVEPEHPTMITVMLGMNDGGWGYTPVPVMHANFTRGYNDLLDALHQASPNADLTLIHPTPYDEITHGTEFPGYEGLVAQLSNDVSEIFAARQQEPGLQIWEADFQTPIASFLTHAKAQSPTLASLLIPDRIHPGDTAHWVMAAALMKAWNADSVVSRVRLNAKSHTASESERTTVTELTPTDSGLRWMQLDEALPLPLDFSNAMTAVLLQSSSIADLDQQTLRVEGLTSGRYQLLIDTKPIASFSSKDLALGVNLALLKTPMVDQARGIDWLEERRAVLEQAAFILRAEVKASPTNDTAEARLRDGQKELAGTIRSKIAPQPHKFELKKL